MKILILLTFLFSLAGCMPNPVGGSGSEGNFDSEFQPYNSSPRNFSITALTPGDASATVSWSSSQNADSYEIHYRSASVLTFTTIDNATSPYTITSLTNSQTYLVIVTAKNERGSTNSQSLTVTPTDNIVVVPGSPVVSYATSAGKTIDFGNTMTVVPSLLNNNGASITNCSSTPALPAWATLNPNTCVISGTPTAPMSATYSIRATNAAGTSSPTSITLTVSALVPAISYLGALNTSGAIDVPMVVNPTLLNSNGSAITSCTSFPALPTWASLHPSTCVISGTPDAPLTLTSYLITATNSIGPSIGATVSLEVSAGIPELSYAAALGTMNFVDSPMTVTPTLLKLNGSAITNCVSSPTLPTWATLDPNTCVITGTPDSTLSPTTYSIVATNSMGDSVGANVTLTAIAFNCPVGYAEVPADAALGVNRFCVMMFEARNNSGAVSEASGTPWTNISLANAKTACTAIGSDDDLISNPEWMAIARNAETVAGNWSTGSVGTGLMPRGHSDNNPSSVLTLSNIGDDYSDTLDTSGSAWEQKRKITLSNGAVIWDLSGNVSEWVDWRTTSGLQTGPTNCSASTQELASVSCAGLASNDYLPSNGSLNSSNGIGRFIGGTSGAPVRGGSWNDSDISGLYSINLGLASIAHSNVGFRCVNRPKAADAPGLSFAGAPGTTVLVGEMMSILPTTLDANGAAITNCTTTPTLPSWASINPSNCEIIGTPTGVMAPTSFDVVATNSVGDSNIATITLTVNGAVPVLSYVGSLGGNGAVGIPMTVSPTVLSGNTLAITNCTSSPALPAWATLNPTTCTISGTPDSFLLSTVYDISAHNSAGASVPASITLSVAAAAPVLSYSGATGVIGNVGVAMSISPTTLVDNGAAITNCTASPALPVWASINTSTCVISGTPTVILPATTYTITATNSVGSSSSNVTFRSNPSVPALSFVGSTGTTINYGSPLSVSPSLLSANGAAITSCSISPALPAWATINSSTCIISGTPTQALAATTYTVRATNSAGQSAPASVILTVNALVPTISYAGATGTTRSINSPMSVAPTTLQSNGATITNCSASPALPAWATLNPITCVISGTPNAMMATTTFTITAGNSAGTSDATVDLTVIAAVPTISYAGATGTIGSIGTAMSVSPTTLNNNGAAVTNCSITPALPAWATIDPITCVISGTPNASLASTTYSIIATNSTGNSTAATVTLRANAAVPTLSYVGSSGTTINYNTLANIAPTTLNNNGASISSCTSTPSLPAWAILNPTTCAITGTATSVLPATTYTIVARNSVGNSAGATLTLQVNATPPTLSFVGSLGTSGAVGVAMSVFPTSLITNGAAVTNCASTPTLPTWATLNPITCRITGTPDAVLPATIYNIVATNSAGDSASAAVTLTIDASAPSLSYSGATGTNGIFGAPMTVAPTLISDNGSTITACTSTPALPAWATLDPVTCVITGTPNAIQASTTYSIRATNSVGNSAAAAVTLSVSAAAPTISYAGATGTTVNFGTAMSVSPTTLITNGAAITGCTTSPALPAWASINPTTCVISGTPNATLAGVTYAVTATNSAGSSAAANVTLTVNAIAPNLSFAGATGTVGYVTLPMTVNPTTLNANGSPITNCTVAPALPTWATLNTTTCVISGTPDATMSAVTYTLTATNAIGPSTGANVTLSVENVSLPELSFAGAAGTTGMVGTPMTVAPTNLDDNGSPVTSCSISPALSGGLVINNSTCIISGTPTALLPATTYTVTVITALGNASDTVTLTVNAGIPTLSYSGATGTTVNINTAMTVAPTLLSNNQSAITACAATPALPAWATLNPTTCVISGTANTVLPATTYSIIATNAIGDSVAASVTLTVNALVPTISYAGATGTSGSVGTAMNVVPTTLQNNGSAITNCTSSPSLPAWATLNTTTCVISGTPTAPLGSTTYNITATNAIGNSTAASVSLSAASAPPLISYSGATGTTVNFGTAMTVTPTTLQNNGSTITSCNSAPALPSGLTIDPATCVISGTATVAVPGVTYTITAANSAGSSTGAAVTLTVNPLAPTLSYAASTGKTVNIQSVMTVTPSTLNANGAPVTNCTVTPALPAWATLNTTTCVISGTPDAILSATTYSVTAVNSVGSSTAASVTLQVNATAPSISYLAAVVKFGDVVSIVPTLDNNGSAITNCTAGSLPGWATINPTTCEITGTPNAVAPLTLHGITVTNSIGSTSTNLSLTVLANVPTLAYAAGTKTGTYGQSITNIVPSTLLANGAPVTSCTSNPVLPTGLTIDPVTCVISGTPTEIADNVPYSIVAQNSAGNSAGVSIIIDINPGLATLVYPATMAKLNTPVTINPSTFASNGAVATCAAPGLPAWATIDPDTCVITGTPTATMPLNIFNVTVTNAAGSNTITLDLGVGAGLPTISYVSLGGAVGVPYSLTPALDSNGGTINACVVTPSLPSWATINQNTCVISGTPDNVLMATTFDVVARNEAGDSIPATITITIAASAPQLAYPSTVDGTFNDPITITPTLLEDNGATVTCSPAVALPTWATLNPNTCVITGTPDATVTGATISITATNSEGPVTANFTLNIAPKVPVISYAPTSYSINFGQSLTVTPDTLTTNGSAIIGCNVSPALPAGLSLHANTCVISGTPTVAQATTNYSIIATNSAGDSLATTISIRIIAQPPSLSYASPHTGKIGTSMTVNPLTLEANGSPITACASNPTLPAGLSINPTTCVISGIPDEDANGNFDITATNSAGTSAAASVTLIIDPDAPQISYLNSPGLPAYLDSPAKVTPSVFRDNGSTTTCTISPAVPAGWATFDPNTCTITGTPTAVDISGTPYTVTATNAFGSTSTNFTLIIQVCPTNYAEVPADATLGTPRFCVMKFEARNDGGKASAQPNLYPWTEIKIADAKAACRALGYDKHYDLISNVEWMAIARNIEGTDSNWFYGNTSTMLAIGHSSVRGVDLETDYDENLLNVTDTGDGYNQTIAFNIFDKFYGFEQRRTMTITNPNGDETIWDFSANAWEWVDWKRDEGLDLAPMCAQNEATGNFEFTTFNPAVCSQPWTANDYKPTNPLSTSANGVGRFYGNTEPGVTETEGYVLRGGDTAMGYVYENDNNEDGAIEEAPGAGIYTVGIEEDPDSKEDIIGFRCVFRPVAFD